MTLNTAHKLYGQQCFFFFFCWS